MKCSMLLLGVDNGADYSVGSPVFQHLLYKIFRDRGLAFLAADAQAPYHSALHWEIEQCWAQARRLLAGQHLGRTAFQEDPLLSDTARETMLKQVTEAGMSEYQERITKIKQTAQSEAQTNKTIDNKGSAGEER